MFDSNFKSNVRVFVPTVYTDIPFNQTVLSKLFSEMIEISVELSTFDNYRFQVVKTAFFDLEYDYSEYFTVLDKLQRYMAFAMYMMKLDPIYTHFFHDLWCIFKDVDRMSLGDCSTIFPRLLMLTELIFKGQNMIKARINKEANTDDIGTLARLPMDVIRVVTKYL